MGASASFDVNPFEDFKLGDFEDDFYGTMIKTLAPEAQPHAVDLLEAAREGSEAFHWSNSTHDAWNKYDIASKALQELDPGLGKRFNECQEYAACAVSSYSTKLIAAYEDMCNNPDGIQVIQWGENFPSENQQPWFHLNLQTLYRGNESDDSSVDEWGDGPYQGFSEDDAALRFAFEKMDDNAQLFHGYCKALVNKFGGAYYQAPTKSYVRASAKMHEYLVEKDLESIYGHRKFEAAASFLLDLERGTIVLPDYSVAVWFLNNLESQLKSWGELTIFRVKNRFRMSQEQAEKMHHYRDILINICFNDGEYSSVYELQVTLLPFNILKQGTHTYYDILRCPPGEEGALRFLEAGPREQDLGE